MWYVPISMKLPAFRCEHFWIVIWGLCWFYLGIFFGVQNITSDLPTSILIMDMISNWQLQFWYFQMIGIWLRYEDCPFPKHRLNLFIEVLENLKRSWWVHLLFRLSEMLIEDLYTKFSGCTYYLRSWTSEIIRLFWYCPCVWVQIA